MIHENKPYRILLYYKYIEIRDCEAFTRKHLRYCKELGVKGRILVSPEGINGTLSGTIGQTERYIETMHEDPRFSDMAFKIDEADEHAFKKIFVRERKEIVTFNIAGDVNPNELTGKRLAPKEFYKAIEEGAIVVDARNDYEYDVGHFRNAIRPGVEAFRDFPEWVRNNLAEYKDKKILTYCTGGIRCEKFSGFLLKEGFRDVSQLDGGIVSYAKDPEVRGRGFDGKCYVFDERITVPVNSAEEYRMVSNCHHCNESCDRYVNCKNHRCHIQHFSCEECDRNNFGFCSKECEEQAACA